MEIYLYLEKVLKSFCIILGLIILFLVFAMPEHDMTKDAYTQGFTECKMGLKNKYDKNIK